MADIFLRQDVANLLNGKRLALFGDSNVRHIYKDLLWLINDDSIANKAYLSRKLEPSAVGDTLFESSAITAGRNYKENRRYQCTGLHIEFYFVTRCWHLEIKKYIEQIKCQKIIPDVIVMNSTLWDLNRWGPKGVEQFKDDLCTLVKELKAALPEKTLFLWTTALPTGMNIEARGYLLNQIEFAKSVTRYNVMEANLYAKTVVAGIGGFDVLDLHYHLRMQAHRRNKDGLHYSPCAVRFATNLILTHIALSWNYQLPNRIDNSLLARYKSTNIGVVEMKDPPLDEMPVVPVALNECKSTNTTKETPTKSAVKKKKKKTNNIKLKQNMTERNNYMQRRFNTWQQSRRCENYRSQFESERVRHSYYSDCNQFQNNNVNNVSMSIQWNINEVRKEIVQFYNTCTEVTTHFAVTNQTINNYNNYNYNNNNNNSPYNYNSYNNHNNYNFTNCHNSNYFNFSSVNESFSSSNSMYQSMRGNSTFVGQNSRRGMRRY